MGNEEQGHCLKAVSVVLPPSKEGGGETCPVLLPSERASVQSLSSDCYKPRNSLIHSCPGPGKLFPA